LSTGGSNFDFAPGRGRIIAATVYNHLIPGYPPPSCAYKLTIQRLDANWKPTNDEPQDEIVSLGPADERTYESGTVAPAKFHPGRAAGPDDDFSGAEPWGNPKYDCGSEAEAEGNVLLVNPDWNKGPDKKSKGGIFSTSLVEHGVKKGLLNGFAPNLVGLEAEFTRFMMEKSRRAAAANQSRYCTPIDLSRPRYARRACSSDDTCVPPHATATRNSAVGQAFLSMRTRPLEPSAGHAIRPPRGLSPTVLLGIHRPQDVRRCRKLAYWPGR